MPSVVASPQFDCPGLKLDELVQLKALAEQNVMELVVKSDVRERSLGWTSVSRETDLAIYKAPDDSRQAWYYLGTMDVLGSVEEAAALFRDDTPELAAIFAPRFGQGIQDEALLYSIAAPSIHNNYMEKIAVKWFCAKSPLHNKLIKPRDACVLECHHAFKYSGRHGWARSLKSIRLASCPELLHSLGYNRVKTYVAGHVFVESEARQGHVTMYYIARADVAGTTHNWFVDLMMKQRCRRIRQVDLFLRQNRLKTRKALGPITLDSTAVCLICSEPLSLVKRRESCVKCGQLVCSKCSQSWQISQTFGQVRHVVVCTICVLPEITKDDIEKSTSTNVALMSFPQAISDAESDVMVGLSHGDISDVVVVDDPRGIHRRSSSSGHVSSHGSSGSTLELSNDDESDESSAGMSLFAVSSKTPGSSNQCVVNADQQPDDEGNGDSFDSLMSRVTIKKSKKRLEKEAAQRERQPKLSIVLNHSSVVHDEEPFELQDEDNYGGLLSRVLLKKSKGRVQRESEQRESQPRVSMSLEQRSSEEMSLVYKSLLKKFDSDEVL
ncbi:hypothetical protein Ae201684_007220 [Aphanomyces euteiches]|uniref:FYVE-type domain-containing protein n=1 Tax=Aphanomyces euteiches TaxID=100861 RepID=A0A6G0X887_9STRA|nr:hypothetical protein Ae201684_007220 [Aphanomyces euteiches]KAH9135542.1 hypothetical protein AeRB84_019078 [Aphanomyces euteiches]